MTKLLGALAALLLLGAGGPVRAPAPTPLDAAGLHALVARDTGSVVLVNIWASWCKPCRAEMPLLVAAGRRHAAEGLRLILLSADDRELVGTDVQRALDSAGVDFPTYIAADSTEEAFINGVDTAWGGALPATLLFDRTGRKVALTVGERSGAQFEDLLAPLLRKGP